MHYIFVMSGKGGVGKSTVAAGLARLLTVEYPTVGLLDVDLTGPSIPIFFGVQGPVRSVDGKLIPVQSGAVEVMSMGLLLDSPADAVIWRGPRKRAMIDMMFRQVAWSSTTSVVVVDFPPGTSDEHLGAIPHGKAAVVVMVSTPARLSIGSVRRSLQMCRQVGLKVAGMVENRSGIECPACGVVTRSGVGVDELAAEFGLPVLARIPVLPHATTAADGGEVCDRVLAALEGLPSVVRSAFPES